MRNRVTTADLPPPVLASRLLLENGFHHAFFTRRGGVSLPPWDSLSFAVTTGDDPAAVLENRRRAAHHLGIAREKLYYLSQVHGTAARLLTGREDWDEVLRSIGDITVSATAGTGCGIRTADCVPILLADRRTGAVAAVHSGWKGTVQNAAAAGIAALRDAIGDPGDLIAAVGPHIERCCFEVGPDVAAQLAACSPLGEAAVLPGIKPHVDLRQIVHAQLEAAGVAPGSIDDVPGCTVCDKERFFSYRRDGQVGGRLLSAIVARG
ncbi:MAG: peptidoglycan editing factor PgeF [Byssovorax sp.]